MLSGIPNLLVSLEAAAARAGSPEIPTIQAKEKQADGYKPARARSPYVVMKLKPGKGRIYEAKELSFEQIQKPKFREEYELAMTQLTDMASARKMAKWLESRRADHGAPMDESSLPKSSNDPKLKPFDVQKALQTARFPHLKPMSTFKVKAEGEVAEKPKDPLTDPLEGPLEPFGAAPKNLTKFEFEDYGVCDSQAFPGVSAGSFDKVEIGIGDTAEEAARDAVDMAHQGLDTEAGEIIDGEIAKRLDSEAENMQGGSSVSAVILENFKQQKPDATPEEEEAALEESESSYYVVLYLKFGPEEE